MFQTPLMSSPGAPSFKSTSSHVSKDVAETALRLLKSNYHLAVGNVACRFRDGVLTITGNVPLYYHKQLAQTLILEENIREIDLIINEIEVT